MDFKAWCFSRCNHNQGWVRYDNCCNPDITQFTEPLTSTSFISFVHNHISRYIDLGTILGRKLHAFFHLFESKVSRTATKTIGLTTDKDSICSILNSYL
ncbi:Uncharacterised protein [Mycobacterium tuberculosis]|nr:Uncharacterised protein [Mycobacterium tuberculosis]